MATENTIQRRGTGWVVAQIPLLFLCFGVSAAVPGGICSWAMFLPQEREAAGVVLAASGILLLVLALLHLGRNLTPFPKPKTDGSLVTTGLYRLVRHPMYGGIILLAFGNALRARTWLALPIVAIELLFFDCKANAEERLLASKFDGYASYRRVTKKMIPWLY